MLFRNQNFIIVRLVIVLCLLVGMFGLTHLQLAHAYTLVVTNTNDSGPGSLRQAILGAISGETISFDPALGGGTITLSSALSIAKDLIIDGSGLTPRLVLSGGNTSRIMQININAQVALSDLEFTLGNSTQGSAIYINGDSGLTLENSTFYQNQASSSGGAISLNGNSSLTITNSTFSNNFAGDDGGAIAFRGNSEGVISDTTLTQNHATNGGAISIFENGLSWIHNSTIAQNHAGGDGGAISVRELGIGYIVNSTITGNQADSRGGAIYLGHGPVNVFNSTFAHNNAANGSEVFIAYSLQFTFYNTAIACLPGASSCQGDSGTGELILFNSILEVGTLADFGLAELADNGGPTQTMALLPGSPLIDAGDNSVCELAPVNDRDQRGVTRRHGNGCDIGAYEFQLTPMIYYVKWNATGANNGTSWDDAYTDLQSAFSATGNGDEIWVAAGTYKPTTGMDRSSTFQLKSDLAIFGGFAGTEENRDQRNPAANPTILSGDIDNNDSQKPFITDLATVTGNTGNAYHVVTGANGATLDGFTITAGYANGDFPYNCGGGMYNSNAASTLANITFIGNLAINSGGGMRNDSSNPALTDIVFSGNSAPFGGGMVNISSSPTLTNVTFNGNWASGDAGQGGGMENYQSGPTLTNVIFSNNSADYGGGMSNRNGSHPTLLNVVFIGNSASVQAGGMSNVFGSSPALTNVTFNGNSSSRGGAVRNFSNSNPLLTNVTFKGNTATYGGGMENNSSSSPTMTNVTFTGNEATYGGAIYNYSNNSQVRNAIFWGNTATSGGSQVYNNSSTPSIHDSVVQGGCPLGSACTNVITSDPMLGVLGDYGGSTHTIPLLPGSSAIDVGNDGDCPATDQRGVTRPQGAGCDIGAYEYKPLPTIYHVKWNATGANNGSSWTDAYTDLQSALSAAWSGDEIWVAAGTYKPTSTTDRAISFQLKDGVAIYGGFAGAETSRAERDPENDPTILSGDIGVAGNNADNSYHVVTGSDLTGSAILEGLILTEGFADGLSPYNRGGGMYLTNSHPSLMDVIFTNNDAIFGAGMSNDQSSPLLTNVMFTGNSASWYGGGISNEDNSNPRLTDVTFDGNTAESDTEQTAAGGMHNRGSSPKLINVTFKDNSSNYIGGGMVNELGSSPELENVTFSNNSADYGGAMLNRDANSNPTLNHVTISNNVALGNGGAIANSGNPVITNSILWGNTGGEIFNLAGTPVITHSIVQGGYTGAGNLDENPLLGPLQDNGGFTQTMALGDGSPSINAADDTNCPDTDQRGLARPQGSHCDMGAYEYDHSTVNVFIDDASVGSYLLAPQESRRASYPGMNNGPVRLVNADNAKILAAERVIYSVNGVNTSFTEMMGLPDHQLDTVYWLPWYNNVDLDTQLRFANVSGATATVHVFIGEQEMNGSPFALAVGESLRKSFPGINDGPVKIQSDVNIVAAERVIYKVNGVNTSFSEMMALPESRLDTTYWLPWYNNTDLDTQLRIANVSASPAEVHVYIGGAEMTGSPFTLAVGESTRKSFAGINNGPVQIVSDHGVPIVAAERVIYRVNGKNTSFSEMMALPDDQLNTIFWLPWYNNVDLDTQLRFANTTNTPATVRVYIGGIEMNGSPFILPAGESTRQSFAGTNSGSVKIVSDVPIVAAERVIYKVNGINTSFSEMMGLPNASLDATFWFPWYNNADLDTQLRFGLP